MDDPRRSIPGTDSVLRDPDVAPFSQKLAPALVRETIREAQTSARIGEIAPDDVVGTVVQKLSEAAGTTLTPVINATGIVIHTNLGRAPLSELARDALTKVAGYVDVEMDMETGKRSSRGTGTVNALLDACPAAEAALVVNNGAAALSLATTATTVAQATPEAVISRGEMVEIGAGFRLPDLIRATGVQIAEVGTTNRTTVDDYRAAITEATGALVKIHPSNYRVSGFTSEASLPELRQLADEYEIPLIVDLGSGLLHPEPALPDEPDAATALKAGADVIIASGDKLLGGPQAGILLGKKWLIDLLKKSPLARAFRADKFTLAGIEATLRSAKVPVTTALRAEPARMRARAEKLAEPLQAPVVEHDGRVGGGGAPGYPLPGYAVQLPESYAHPLRTGTPAILTRVHDGHCLLDVRCIPAERDAEVAQRLVKVTQMRVEK